MNYTRIKVTKLFELHCKLYMYSYAGFVTIQ